MGLLLGGAAAGWAEQKGYFKKLPQVGGSAAISLVIAGYATQRFLGGKHRAFKAAGLAMMVAGAFDFGRVQAGGTSGLDEHGEFGET
jgi:hypothetical protein